jgi:outer membrane protein
MSLPRKLVRFAPLTALLALTSVAAGQTANPGTAAPGGPTPPPTTKGPTTPPAGAPVVDAPSTTAAPPGAKTDPTAAGTATTPETVAVGSTALTADLVAAAAVKTSKYAAVDEAKLKVAAAQVDAAWDQFWPRLTFSARYTRLSPITPPNFGGGSGFSTVVAPVAAGQQVPAGAPLIGAPAFSFPVILDQYAVQASLLVPVSDYVFRTWSNHKSALASYDAAKFNAEVTKMNASADARVAFYNYLRARGTVIVAKSAVGQAEAHLKDMKNRLDAKVVTVADVARVEATLANAQLAVIKSENLVIITDANVRMMMHASGEQGFTLGEDLDAELPPMAAELPKLKAAAYQKRPELKAVDAQIAALDATSSVVAAGLYPRLDAIGNVLYANPNQRFIPQSAEWKATWDVSLQLSWSPNDALIASDNKKAVSGNIAVLKATKEQISDGLALDVTSAYTKVREAEASIATTKIELRAAEEAYRVRKEQFTLGTTTSALLIDAEADVTRARLNHLNARVDLRIARVLLKKSTGELQ